MQDNTVLLCLFSLHFGGVGWSQKLSTVTLVTWKILGVSQSDHRNSGAAEENARSMRRDCWGQGLREEGVSEVRVWKKPLRERMLACTYCVVHPCEFTLDPPGFLKEGSNRKAPFSPLWILLAHCILASDGIYWLKESEVFTVVSPHHFFSVMPTTPRAVHIILISSQMSLLFHFATYKPVQL